MENLAGCLRRDYLTNGRSIVPKTDQDSILSMLNEETVWTRAFEIFMLKNFLLRALTRHISDSDRSRSRGSQCALKGVKVT